MYRDCPAFIKSLKRLKDTYPYVKGRVAPLHKLCVTLILFDRETNIIG